MIIYCRIWSRDRVFLRCLHQVPPFTDGEQLRCSRHAQIISLIRPTKKASQKATTGLHVRLNGKNETDARKCTTPACIPRGPFSLRSPQDVYTAPSSDRVPPRANVSPTRESPVRPPVLCIAYEAVPSLQSKRPATP